MVGKVSRFSLPALLWCSSCVLVGLLTLSVTNGTPSYYVDAFSGDDSNSGLSPEQAWRSLQKAADIVPAGGTVTVAPGTYARTTITRSGIEGAPLTFKAGGAGTLVQGFTLEGAKYVVLDGFEITVPREVSLDDWDIGSGVSLIDVQYCEVKNGYIHHTLREGVMLFSNAGADNPACGYNKIVNNRIAYAGGYAGITLNGAGHVIEGNDISHTIQHPLYPTLSTADGADADGILFFGRDHVIRRNKIHSITLSDTGNVDPHTDAFQTYGPAYNILIERNEINLSAAEGVAQAAMISQAFPPVRDLVIRYNVVTAYRGFNVWGIDDGTETPVALYRATVANNTFYGVRDYDIELHNCPGSVVKNNLLSASGRYMDTDSDPDTSHNGVPEPLLLREGDVRIADPQFVNEDARDFHLRFRSPLIDAGAPVEDAVDFDGTPVPQGKAPDIGAFEYKPDSPYAPGLFYGCSPKRL